MQVGNILKFGLDHMPFVRGVHFQPISYFGRCSQKRPQNPITIPKMLRLIEEQTEGLMKIEDFAGGGAENPYCSFHASYLRKGERELKLLEKNQEKDAAVLPVMIPGSMWKISGATVQKPMMREK